MKQSTLKAIVYFIVCPLLTCLLLPTVSASNVSAIYADEDTVSPQAELADDADNSIYLVSQDGSQSLKLNHINYNIDAPPQKSNYLALFTSGANVTNTSDSNEVFVKKNNTAIQVDASGKVVRVVGPNADPPTEWDENEQIAIPEDGYIVLASDNSWGSSVFRKPLFNYFKVGDVIKLMKGGEELTAKDFLIEEPVTEPETDDLIEVEAAPIDITIGVEGPRKTIDYIDKDVSTISNILALFTRNYGKTITVPKNNVAVQVGADSRVMHVVNPSINGQTPEWTGPTDLDIPEGGYVLFAQDNSYATLDIKKYLATNFKVGDAIKLRKNGDVVPVTELMSGSGPIAKLKVDNYAMYTVVDNSTTISGQVSNFEDINEISLTMNDTTVPLQPDGTFSYSYPLAGGTNYVDVKISKDGTLQDTRSLVVFSRPGFSSEKEVILWVDQAANARKFQSSQFVLAFLQKAKDNGVTSIVFDVKGVEGYASYKKNDLTGRPYVSEITAPAKAGSNPDLDLLEEFITHGHSLGLKIHAAINVFAEGSIASNEYAVLDQHLDWEERVYFPENNGEIKRLRESAKQGLVAFVNPANEEVRDYQLKTFKEIIKNYNVDGIVHDRGRYDNESADFSEETRVQFEAFLQARGKQLVNWPTDIYSFNNNNARVDGPLIQDWWEFRSGVIKSFFNEVKDMVDAYETETNRNIQVSTYVGSWYESYYLNGVNWGSPNFRNDPRLGLGSDSVYTDDYYNTSYMDALDFLMIGAYQTTAAEVEKYITLGNIVTNGEIPLYAGIALTNVQKPELQREVFQAGLKNTNGLMLFDASQINWPIASAALRDEEYVKDYQLGISIPGQPDSFLEGNFYNINLIEGNINVFSDAFSTSTGTSRFGVEAVVDASGQVTRMANRNQAINWSWGSPEENNSEIPLGGFVVSTLDPSGTRTNRQLVANMYNIGDQVRSAVLSGLLDNEGKETTQSHLELTGLVEVLGPGEASVLVNGIPATLNMGSFTANVPLAVGENMVSIEVYVDDYLTNRKAVKLIRKESNSGSVGTGYVVQNPERMTVSREQGSDGRSTVIVDVNLMEELKQLQSQANPNPVLVYTIDGEDDLALVNLPVQALKTFLKEISDGKLIIETHLGKLELPISALKDALAASGDSESLQLSLGRTDSEHENAIHKRIAAEDGNPLGESLRFGMLLFDKTAQSASGIELSSLNGYAKLTIAVPANTNPARMTALLSLSLTDELLFVPALMKKENGNFYAELILSGTGNYSIANTAKSFSDTESHWAKEEIELLASKWIVRGMGGSDNRFAPDEPLTRAQFTTLLVRALGLREDAGAAKFEDVQLNEWYAGAVGAAEKAGLVKGYEDGTFRPNARITRAQMSVMLLNVLNLIGTDPASGASNGADALKRFTDYEAIAGWSESAVGAIVQAGLMEGRADNRFDPQALATRAEGTVVLKRLLLLAQFIDG